MKPFLLFQLRPNTQAADGELNAILKFSGLTLDNLHYIRMEKKGLPEINLNDYSAVLVGGGPFNTSDDENKKSPEQKKFETQLRDLMKEIIKKDFPFLGECYGLGFLAQQLGGKVSKEKYTENVGGSDVILTEEGKKDPLLAGLDKQFRAFVGHKEACQEVPPNSTLLATSKPCLVQMIRVKSNIYGTQFHPELDVDSIIERIYIYKNAGYFPPEEAEPLANRMKDEKVFVPNEILRRFVEKYKK